MSLAQYHSVDLAKRQAEQGGLSIQELENFLSDMRSAPAWRARADIECDYYDSNQHTPDEIDRAERLGLPIITINLIFSTINLLLGMEVQARTDFKVEPDGPMTTQDAADAMTVKLVEAERVTKTDRACGDAYASQMKAGLGWVHVGYNLDPFSYKHRVEAVDRREIWWDMRGKEDDTMDWRYLVRRKWHDADHLIALFPKTIAGVNIHDLVAAVVNHTAPWDYTAFQTAIPLMMDGMIARDWNGDFGDDWRDSERKRALLYETWYRTWVRGYTMKLPDGRVVEYNERDPVHIALAGTGTALPRESVFSKVRMSWWLGPFRLYDGPSPFTHRFFPYVPFFAYREDKTRVPYGQIRVMMSMQDEINARRAKMLWQLSASRTIVRDEAFADHQQAASEINRPDAYLKIKKDPDNKNRSLTDIISIDDHQGLNAQQFQAYKDSIEMLTKSAGVYGPMMGDAEAGAEAGVAIDMLIRQGSTNVAKPNENFRFARTLVGEQLLANVVADMAESAMPIPVQLPANHPTKPGQQVVLNQPQQKIGNITILSNDVTRLKTKVALSEIPNSAGYQQQQFQLISEILKGLPPELQPIILDIWVQASNVPNKHEIAARIRKATGQAGPPPDPSSMSPQQLAIAEGEQQAAMAAQATAQQMNDLQNLGMAAEIEEKKAQIKLTEAQVLATLQKIGEPVGQVMARVNQPDIQGAVRVNIQPPPEPVVVGPDGKPKPGGGPPGKGEARANPRGGQPGDARGGQRRPPQERAVIEHEPSDRTELHPR